MSSTSANNSRSLSIKTGIVISSLFLLLVMQGCSDIHNMVWNKADATIDGHHIVISPCRNSYTRTINDTPTDRNHIFGCGNTIAVQIRNEELTVNDKKYGMLNRGDSIVVKSGHVYINTKEAVEVAQK
ncbi:MAG: hypothetical protein ICV60_22355 [Pyrinomonadaceae bacterium]|nr:hypothetical protein [Pyrinomonadaceae bacterium]